MKERDLNSRIRALGGGPNASRERVLDHGALRRLRGHGVCGGEGEEIERHGRLGLGVDAVLKFCAPYRTYSTVFHRDNRMLEIGRAHV